MTMIYLIRHGQKVHAPGDIPLTALGLEQARYTAELLHTKGISKIIASPRRRTTQTAQVIAGALGLDVAYDNRLVERMEWDANESQTYEELMITWRHTQRDRHFKPPYGNSSIITGNYMEEVINVYRDSPEPVLIVTHGGSIGDFLLNIFSPVDLRYVHNEVDNHDYPDIRECSVTIVEYDAGSYHLRQFADTSHLPQNTS